MLRRAGWGWLDRRGHLRMWTSGVRIEAPVPGIADNGGGAGANPWTTVGLELALAALIDPTQPVTARRMAPVIGRSVGAVHDIIGRFSNVGLVGNASHLPLLPDLFWETAAHWPDNEWLGLPVSLEAVAERLGSPTLVRVDERAATLGGARHPGRRRPPGPRLPPERPHAPAGARPRRPIRGDPHVGAGVSPVTYLPENPGHPPTELHPWRVAHPMICALRLAADPARGREVVDDWGIVPEADS